MNIFVANLNFKLQDDDLRGIFEEYGEVSSAKIIMDRETGRSRGFGFVEMQDDEQAQEAIDQLNEVEIEGKVIKVSKAKPRKQNQNRNFRGNNNYSNRRY